MIKLLIFILLTLGVILTLIYVAQLIFGSNEKSSKNSLSDLKLEVDETTTKYKETKEKVETVGKEVDDMKENLKNS
jgi:sensor histidine kinase regulating citrate/malate metabolism